MFTGISVDLGKVGSMARSGSGAVVMIEAPGLGEQIEEGDSIMVNGACLTAREIVDGGFVADVSLETLRLTDLGDLKTGDRVNLEPSLRADGKLGGHFVTGHVEGVGTVLSRRREGDSEVVRFSAPSAVLRAMVEKGSVAVDGVSLTVTAMGEGWFEVALIPHTLDVTTLGSKGSGSRVNLESDLIGRYIIKTLEERLGQASGESIIERFASDE